MKKIKISSLPEFNIVDYLTNEIERSQYIEIVALENNIQAMQRAIATVEKSREYWKNKK